MKQAHILLAIISISGIFIYYQFLWKKGGLFLIGIAVLIELIIVTVRLFKKE